jgi:ribulose-phosphate 3-epimerase
MLISTSILSADFLNLGMEIDDIISAKTDWIHCDIMDGSYVESISFGHNVVKNVNVVKGCLKIDTHLMVNYPERQIDKYLKYSDFITIHSDSISDFKVEELLLKIKNSGVKCGLAIKPKEDIFLIEKYLNLLDLLLIMSVEPGLGGQLFIENSLEKIKIAKDIIDRSGRDILISVDGGVNNLNSAKIKSCGANVLVCGSYIFQNNNYNEAIKSLKDV